MSKRNEFFYFLGLLKSLTFNRVLNLAMVETGFLLSRLFRKVIVFGKPWAASIEPTTSCNLRCTECPTGMHSLTRSKGNLKTEDFRNILDRLSPELLYLTLYFQGEPLLNPHFIEMVSLARSRGVFVATSTNGHFLDSEKSAEIVQSRLNHLIISVDGLDQATYEKYRVNGNLSKVLEGIEILLAARRKANSRFPFIEIQFIVMSHNEHQIPEMKEFANRTGIDRLSFKTAQVYNFNSESSIIPTLSEKSRYRQNLQGEWVPSKKLRNHCHRIWSSIVVTWDGNVVPCCYDKDAIHKSGNLLEEPISIVWKNQKNNLFRRQVLRDRSMTEICRNCGE